MSAADPLAPFLRRGAMILDGGLATELERLGADLTGGLWSARCLRDGRELIRQVHLAYLEAGADCIASASYQATIEGFVAAGESVAGAEGWLRGSVLLAREARDGFWTGAGNRRGRERPLVAASIGPYGAYLADGSEYTGAYDLEEGGLVDFHRRRWHLLAECHADLMACETIPSAAEARALQRLLHETPTARAWFSFCCRDGEHLADGERLGEALVPLRDDPQIVALGVNCVAPRLVDSLIGEVRRATEKPIVVYPNSGERYDAAAGCWQPAAAAGKSASTDLATAAKGWWDAGARILGGCCRTGPAEIRAIRRRLLPPFA